MPAPVFILVSRAACKTRACGVCVVRVCSYSWVWVCLFKPHLILMFVAPSPCAPSDAAPSSYELKAFHCSLTVE